MIAARVKAKPAHTVETIEDAYGHKAVCSCGTFSLGYFSSGARAKRAMMNCSHPDEPRTDSHVKFVETA